jgi:hypothetical protein
MVLKVFVGRHSTTRIRDILSWPGVTLVASTRLYDVARVTTRYSYLMNCLHVFGLHCYWHARYLHFGRATTTMIRAP